MGVSMIKSDNVLFYVVDCEQVNFKRKAFTLAEILLSLSVIGIVAAIALPSLLGNIHERAFETQKKALYTRFSQSIPLLPSINGYGELVGNLPSVTEDERIPDEQLKDTAAESFVRDGLSKVMKITNICDNEHLTDCGLPDKIIPLNNGTAINLSNINMLSGLNEKIVQSVVNNVPGASGEIRKEMIDTKAAAFETINGESILVHYNPNCQPDFGELKYGTNSDIDYSKTTFPQPKLCANFIFDLNGKKGPNTVGKDIGVITVLYSTDSTVVSPNPYPTDSSSSITSDQISEKCREKSADAKVPTIDEATSMFFNKKLFNLADNHYWSSTKFSSLNKNWLQSATAGSRWLDVSGENSRALRCLKP